MDIGCPGDDRAALYVQRSSRGRGKGLPNGKKRRMSHKFPVIAIPVLYRREAGHFFENEPEGFGVGIAYLVHGLIDTDAGSLEVLFDHFHFYALNILHHGVTCGMLKPALEVPAAERDHGSDLADRYPGVDILLDKFLCGADGGIFVILLAAEDDEGRLTAALNVYLEPFGAS